MKNVRVIRLQTGEDVIADLEEGSERHTLKKAFVIIPMQSKPGQPVQLMMTPYMPYSADDEIVIENPLRVNEKFVIPMLVEAVKELSAKVTALENA